MQINRHRRRILATSLALPLGACLSPLDIFNAVTPKDHESARTGLDLAYAPGHRHTLDVYAPTSRSGPLPIIMFFYGGAWREGKKQEYEFVGRALAAQGFVTVVPDYRLVPETQFPGFVEDCAAALRWVQDNIAAYGGDAGKVVLCGHSAGAYNAIMLALDPTYCQRAGARHSAIKGAVGLSGPYDFLPFESEPAINAFGSALDPELTQPVHFARPDAPPLLLIWGDKDERIARRNIEGLERAMRAAGGSIETKIYAGVNHGATMTSLSRMLRGGAPSLVDISAFARRVTTPGASTLAAPQR
jgi:acetyl esterase/lipase